MTLDYTPFDWFTIAFGPLVRVDTETYGCAGGVCTTTTTEVIVATVRFDFHIVPSRIASSRRAFTIGLVADLGATVAGQWGPDTSDGGGPFTGPGVSYGAYLTVGYAHY